MFSYTWNFGFLSERHKLKRPVEHSAKAGLSSRVPGLSGAKICSSNSSKMLLNEIVVWPNAVRDISRL